MISVAEHLSERSQRAFVPLLPLLIFLLCFGCSIASQRRTYFSLDSPAALEATYSGSPFAAAPAVAEYVKSNSLPGDRIAVLGSEPEIYFYSQQRSATGYLYMYSLIVQHKYAPRMRAEFMHELETNHPKYLVYVDIWDSWGEREGAAQAVSFLQWMQNYMNEGYEQVGAAEVGPDGQYSWVDAANTDQHARHNLIYVLRQRPSAELR